jgi:hypothetical protein
MFFFTFVFSLYIYRFIICWHNTAWHNVFFPFPFNSSTIEPNFQCVNEATPEGSEIEYKIPSCQKTPPPKKNKKSENLSSNKKNKLAPKELNFPIRTAGKENVRFGDFLQRRCTGVT